MIKKDIIKFCKDYSKIENYEQALNDSNETWCLHHRLETHKYKDRNRKEWIERDECIPMKELIALGLYFDRPPEELIFLTRVDHQKIHTSMISKETRSKLIFCKERNGFYRKKHSEETRKLMSEKAKGRVPWNKGRHYKIVDHKAVLQDNLR